MFTVEASLFAYLVDYLKCSREEAMKAKEQLKRLHEHSSSLLREQALETMCAQVLKASLDLLCADRGCIHLCLPQEGLKLMHEFGFGSDDNVIERLSSLSSEAHRQKRRITFDEIGLNKNFSELAVLFDQYQIGDAQSIPLLDTEGRCFGVVSTFTASRRYFLDRDVSVLDLYIDQARRILATKLNEERLEREVLEQRDKVVTKDDHIRLLRSDLALLEQRERQQLAPELHDYLCQLLALALIKIKQAQQSLSPSSSACVQHLQETEKVLRRSVSYARSLMAELNPPALNDAGLPAALQWLAEQMSFHDLAVDVQMSCDTVPVTKDKAVVLYRSVRELLINVSKHARVSRATLSVAMEGQLLCIGVQDRGRGFDTSSSKTKNPGHNYGLASVSERLEAIGGWLKAESVVGQGSNMKLCLPLGNVGSEYLRAASCVEQHRVVSVPKPANQDQTPLL